LGGGSGFRFFLGWGEVWFWIYFPLGSHWSFIQCTDSKKISTLYL
jgi:hypothetical protein